MDCQVLVRQWRRWLRPLVFTLYVILIVIALPLLIIDFQLKDTKKYKQAWFIAGFFVLITIPISVWGIVSHLIHYTRPDLQRCIIRFVQ